MLAEVPPVEDAERLMNIPNSEGKLIWGPWRIPGAFGIAINAFACVYLLPLAALGSGRAGDHELRFSDTRDDFDV